jgi:hypothetical protein
MELMRRLIPAARRARIWVVRVAASFLLLTGFLPRALAIEYWRWLISDMGPQHPCFAQVLIELAELEARHA